MRLSSLSPACRRLEVAVKILSMSILDRLSTTEIAVIVSVYLALSLHTAISMGRYGRRWWVWLIITVLFTPAPAAVVSCVDYVRKLLERQHRLYEVEPPEDAIRRCPHCRAVLPAGKARGAAGVAVCPKCGMAIDQDNLA